MNEEICLRVGYIGDCYVLLNKHGQYVHTLAVGDVIEVQQGALWCPVRVQSGGYKGFYYVTSDGQSARFALCMQVSMVEQHMVPSATNASLLERLRLAWVGRRVQSRVALAGGRVSGVVREITERGQVVFVYTPRSNSVPVVASLPVARLDEFLMPLLAS